MPKPLQNGGVPIWVSGTVNKLSMRRLATFGWGGFLGALTPLILHRALNHAKSSVAYGRDPDEIQVIGRFR